MDDPPESSSVSITRIIVADLLSRSVALHSTYPDIVGWVGWINDAGTAW